MLTIAGNRLYIGDLELTQWSSATRLPAHYHQIRYAVESRDKSVIFSLSEVGDTACWQNGDYKWCARLADLRANEITAIAISDARRALVATANEVHLLQRGNWENCDTLKRFCSFPVGITATKLEWIPDGILATDADGKTELIRIQF